MAATDSRPAPQGQAKGLAERLSVVHRRIADAAARADRQPAAVTLVAVSKGFPAAIVEEAHEAGQVDFGESRAQELTEKNAELAGRVRWHFVGRLQRNKVGAVVGTVSLLHSVDRLPLAEAVAERARRLSRVQRVLVQVNADEDPDKAGCRPEDALELVARVRGIDGVACEGLMTMPALGPDPRPAFRRLRLLRDDLRERFPEVQHLSMGMSGDFETAVEEGATIVRVGEAIFGPRAS
jgi:PLP dependent protein